MKRATNPFHMGLVVSQKPPKSACRPGLGNLPETKHLRHHQEHHQTAVGIYRTQPRWNIDRRMRLNRPCGFQCQRVHRVLNFHPQTGGSATLIKEMSNTYAWVRLALEVKSNRNRDVTFTCRAIQGKPNSFIARP